MYSFEHGIKNWYFFEHGQTEKLLLAHMILKRGGDFVLITFEEICKKEIINITDGSSLGFAGDILFDCESRKITALIIKKKPKIFGFFEKEDDVSIIWDKIESVGKDAILVNTESLGKIHNENESFLRKFFKFFLS